MPKRISEQIGRKKRREHQAKTGHEWTVNYMDSQSRAHAKTVEKLTIALQTLHGKQDRNMSSGNRSMCFCQQMFKV